MLNKEISHLLNNQVKNEFYSAYLYLDFSNYYYNKGLDGFGNWFKVQAMEEKDHAIVFIQYLQNNGEDVKLETIKAPDSKKEGIIEILNEQLEHERYVTGLINNIYSVAHNIKDFRTMQFLDWFVKEQGEEEQNAETLIRRFELFGDDKKGLYMLDNELKERTYTPIILPI